MEGACVHNGLCGRRDVSNDGTVLMVEAVLKI